MPVDDAAARAALGVLPYVNTATEHCSRLRFRISKHEKTRVVNFFFDGYPRAGTGTNRLASGLFLVLRRPPSPHTHHRPRSPSLRSLVPGSVQKQQWHARAVFMLKSNAPLAATLTSIHQQKAPLASKRRPPERLRDCRDAAVRLPRSQHSGCWRRGPAARARNRKTRTEYRLAGPPLARPKDQ